MILGRVGAARRVGAAIAALCLAGLAGCGSAGPERAHGAGGSVAAGQAAPRSPQSFSPPQSSSPQSPATPAQAGARSPAASAAGAAGTPSAAPAASPVRSCRLPGGPRPTLQALTVGGVDRFYLLARPAGPGPFPVVVDFHGYQQNAAQQDAYSGMSAAGTAAGFAVVTPQGVQGQWNFVRRPAVGPDDVAFVAAVLGKLKDDGCIDSRVYATGMSDGADMADTLACGLPQLVRAVAPVAPSVNPVDCRENGSLHISYREYHGDADPIVPFGGGGGDRPPPFQGTEAVSALQRMVSWTLLDRCHPGSPETVTGAVARITNSCPGGVVVELVVIRGGGHTWPGATVPPPVGGLGATSTQLSATRDMLAFFRQHG